MKLIEKEQAISLRKKGKSINEIVEALGVSKASVSIWVRDIILTQKQKNKLSKNGRSVSSIEKRRESRLINQKNKDDIIIAKARRQINTFSKKDLKLAGILLYLGEGGKTKRGVVRISNSDPLVIKIMMKFFREICLVPEHKFAGHIHTFAQADIKKTELYWSKITGIPTEKFYKTYIKPSSASLQKRKTLPFGTFDIYINDTKLFLTIMTWIQKVIELALNI